MWWTDRSSSHLPSPTSNTFCGPEDLENTPSNAAAYWECCDCQSISIILYFVGRFFLALVYLIRCSASADRGQHNRAQACVCMEEGVLEQVQRKAELQLASFFFSPPGWLRCWTAGCGREAMTAENQVLYPLLFVAWAQNFGDFVCFSYYLAKRMTERGRGLNSGLGFFFFLPAS